MSEQDDALRAMAANRGCKLVRSRRRKPGGDFGRYGLKDAKNGREVLGFGERGLTATAEEIEGYLRGGLKASWKRSLVAAVPDRPASEPARRGRKKEGAPEKTPTRTKRAAAAPRKPESRPSAEPARAAPRSRSRPEPEPPAPKPPQIREARPKDAAAIADLIVALGYDVSETDIRRRLTQLTRAGRPALVADQKGVVACLTWHVTPVLHRPRPVGRITMMVVAEKARSAGIGTALVAAAEGRLRAQGCGLVEVTSNMERMRAHGFYERLGYRKTSYRFAKTLQE